jgi:hypothetical protein
MCRNFGRKLVFCAEVCGFGNAFVPNDLKRKTGPAMQEEMCQERKSDRANGEERTDGGVNEDRAGFSLFSPLEVPFLPLFHISPLKAEAVYSSETWVSAHRTAWHHNTKDSNLFIHPSMFHLTLLS